MANTKLTRTFGSGGNRVKWTWSGWIKRTGLGSAQAIFTAYENANNHTYCRFDSDDELRFEDQTSGNTNGRIVSNMKFRDINCWYHLVLVFDKNNSTSGDRIKMYVNGERITSFSDTGNTPFDTSQMNNESLGREHEIGCFNNTNFFNGVMSHIHFCDGYAYLPSDFGETDSTTGNWKIKTSPSVSYGTTGYWILKDGNSVTDSSTNSNAWTVGGGTLTKTEDCPSNVFATWNILDSHYFWGAEESSWCTNGNTKARSGNSQYSSSTATLGASSGKYYWEIKLSAASNSEKYFHIGIKSKQDLNTQTGLGSFSTDYAYRGHNGNLMYNDNSTSYGDTYQVGDIVGVAMDLDNNRLFFSKNGVWQNSGDPTSSTGAISITDPASTDFGFYVPAWSWNDGSSYGTIEANFGNGAFGSTQLTGTTYQASGIGIFKYQPPTGYTALSTKGLNL